MLLTKLLKLYEDRPDNQAQPHSFRQYGFTVSRFKEFLERSPQVSDLKRETISAFVKWMSDRGSPRTANSKRQHLVTLARFACDEDLLGKIPTRILRAKEMQRVPDSWSPEEVGQILKSCEAELMDRGFGPQHWQVLVKMVYFTTARKTALMKSLKTDVRDGKFRLAPENQKRNNEQFFDLPEDVLKMIAELPQSDDPRLLPWPYVPETLDKRFDKILIRAGLPTGRRHKIQKLRRTAVTQFAIAHGVEQAQIRAGHSDQKVTWSAYLDTSRMPSGVANGIARPT